jgi:poly-gamma-glutamate synthesis protein (capsule biosynthesis protein)
MKHFLQFGLGWLLLIGLLSGCVSSAPPTMITPFVTETGLPVPTQTPTATLTPPPGLGEVSAWVSPAVPPELVAKWILPEQVHWTEDPMQADLILQPDREGEIAWVFALVTPFPNLLDEVELNELQAAWAGQLNWAADVPLGMSSQTLATLKTVWGEPGQSAVWVEDDAELLLAQAWANQRAWAIVPFSEIEPRWKVVRVNGQSPFDRDLDVLTYPLTVRFAVQANERATAAFGAAGLPLPTTLAGNRDPERLSLVLLTGTTALVRATAYTINQKGIEYPAEDILPWLQAADLVHISNESSFNPACPVPGLYDSTMLFCSDPAHVELFSAMGVDIVELSGNHLADRGREALMETIRMLEERGMRTYAAGENAEAARQALLVEDHGNRLAFIGCNNAGPDHVWATAELPGVANCEDMQWMIAAVQRLRKEGYLPIVTFQYKESLGSLPAPWEVSDFRSMVDAGALVVSGSQAHYPMTFEFYQGGLIHYGLGNFIFDQMYELGTRQELLDRHVFYDGRYLGVEVLTAMLEDYSRPRPMTVEEREALLGRIFADSGWKTFDFQRRK